MLTVEVRVNGNIVAELQALNLGRAGDFVGYRYGGSVHPEGAGFAPITFSGRIHHTRDEGILTLVRIILEDIE